MQLTAPRSVSPLRVARISNLQPRALSGAVADLVLVRSMRGTRRTTLAAAALLLVLTQLCAAQLGATKEELVKRYGACSPVPGGRPGGPHNYSSVIDDGCGFSDGQLGITAFFKADRVVMLYFAKEPTLWESFFHPALYLALSDDELSSLLHVAVPDAEWLPTARNAVLQTWRTSDSSAFAYYFAGGHSDLHALIVQTAVVDQVYRKVEKFGSISQRPNQAMQPTAGRRTAEISMTQTSTPATTRALASGG